ncbi:MAG: thermonuclease family protein [Solirubrobacterales bacterium]|nr:thermonuclease family protein [Solirubrobacterales bacterium]
MPRLLLPLAAVLALLGAGCDASTLTATTRPSGGALEGRVVKVVDGDTIRVDLGGPKPERVRYIGIDTPESVKPGTPVQCYAKAASAANERLVGGRRVRLVLDVEERDRYGRLLAYVYAGSRFVNAELVRGGYALPLTIPPNVRHADAFARLAREARRAGTGLWKACRQ